MSLILLVEQLKEHCSEDTLTYWLPCIKLSAEFRHHLDDKLEHTLSTPVCLSNLEIDYFLTPHPQSCHPPTPALYHNCSSSFWFLEFRHRNYFIMSSISLFLVLNNCDCIEELLHDIAYPTGLHSPT